MSARTKTTKNETFDFEASVAELESDIEKIDTGSLTLEESMATYEKSMKLLKSCQKFLQEAELKINSMAQSKDDTDLSDHVKS